MYSILHHLVPVANDIYYIKDLEKEFIL